MSELDDLVNDNTYCIDEAHTKRRDSAIKELAELRAELKKAWDYGDHWQDYAQYQIKLVKAAEGELTEHKADIQSCQNIIELAITRAETAEKQLDELRRVNK